MFQNWIKNKLIKAKLITLKDSLLFIRQYKYNHTYGFDIKYTRESIETIINKYKSNIENKYGVSIESEFNGINYAVFDLDNKYHLNLFERLYSNVPHVIFISSRICVDNTESLTPGFHPYNVLHDEDLEHYWGIVDIPYNKKQDIYQDHNWKVCNDQEYIKFCMNYNSIRLRGLYENENRKPKLEKTCGKLSKNFKLFIDKLTTFYNNEGLELSVLRYKDPSLLIKYNRKIKLKNLNDNI